MPTDTKPLRGFALMEPDKRREIARKGAAAIHARGTAHQFTHESGKIAGRKGGIACGQMRARERAAKEMGGE